MKKIMVIAALAIVCQVATANAQCLGIGLRFFAPHIGISIGVPAPVVVVSVVPPVGCYAYGCANPYPYYGYPRPVGYYGGYRGGYYNRGYRGGYYAHRR